MRKFWIITVIAFMTIAMTSCGSSKPLAETYHITEIAFGYGGGFAGTVTRYVIKGDGKLYKDDAYLQAINKDEQSAIWKCASHVSGGYNKPGNTFHFVRIVKDNETVYYCWELLPPQEIAELNKLVTKYL